MPTGTVRLTTFGWASRTILAPRLPAFLLEYPDVLVEVIVEDRVVDIVAGGFDAGIRLASAVERDMVSVPVGPDLRPVVVGTPGYFGRHDPPQSPAYLNTHVCINYRQMGGGGLLPWEFELDGRNMRVRVRVAEQLIVNDETLSTAAVRAGAGLGYMIEHDVADEIANGRLIQVLAPWCPAFPGCRLYYPDRRVGPAVRALVEALRWQTD